MARLSVLVLSFLSLSLVTTALPAETILARGENDTQTPHSFYDLTRNIPRLNYVPHKTGIPYTIENVTAKPWLNTIITSGHPKPDLQARASCSPLTPNNPSQWWYEAINHNGESSYMFNPWKSSYKVFRNVVTDFGADNTGARDATSAIQNAINAGATGGPSRTSNSMGTTGQPAIVYIPKGTYLLHGSLQLYVGTVLVGDPLNPPVLKAAAGFPNDHVIFGKDPNQGGTVNFYIGLKNVIIDSTAVNGAQKITLLDWTVSQGTQLTNVVFQMPNFSTGHVGVTSQYDSNSNIILNDLTFNGGAIGLSLSGQQWILKNIVTNGATTGISVGAFEVVCHQCHFSNGATGIDANAVSGTVTVIDSTANFVGNFVTASANSGAGNAVILDGVTLTNSGNTVVIGGNVALTGNVPAGTPWVKGSVYSFQGSAQQISSGQFMSAPRPAVLTPSGNWFTKAPPTFDQYSVAEVINIKSVPGLPVMGDGVTDDTNNINAILAQNAGCKIVYFPSGTYIVTNTIHVPVGSRIYGDAYAATISALGSAFFNPSAPVTMFQVGNPGDVGVAQIVDMMFTTADVLQGCKLVEVHMAGPNPGDVGFWNSHFRIGGAAGTLVQTNCGGTPDQCKADWGLLHLSNTSSAYIENMWGWCADHDLDGGHAQTISCGRGLLVEATKGTWLVGTAMEHHTLYQYNFEFAQFVFSAFQQSETPYWQGAGSPDLAPVPWASNLIPSDPNFSNCAAGDAGCRMAFFERIRGSSEVFLYGGGVWTFFNNNVFCNGDCQQNAIRILTSSQVYHFGTNVKAITNMILENTVVAATEFANRGGWGGAIGAYLHVAPPPAPNPTPGGGPFVTGAGLSWYDPTFSDGNGGYADPQFYQCYRGPASNFPPIQQWMNYNTMFNLNQQTSMVPAESGPIQGDIYNAIMAVSKAALVDARLILAVIMQESTGNVFVPCTNNGFKNCGLMQAFAGSVSFDPNNQAASILQMVKDGTQGTSLGPGLVQWFNNQDFVGSNTNGNPYEVCRGYNSGSINFNDLSDPQGATASYVSDIANRLQGWNGNDGEGHRAACGF